MKNLNLIRILLNEDYFNLIINVFIGITALIISLTIFTMDKGKYDKRNIFKVTLLNYSRVNDLIILTLTNYLLIIIQSFLMKSKFGLSLLCLFYIRLFVLFILIWITIKLFLSFMIVIKIFVNDNYKNDLISKTFSYQIKKIAKLAKKNSKKRYRTNSILENELLKLSCITYSQDWYYGLNNNYNLIMPKTNGNIVNINYSNLSKVNKKIEKFILSEKLEYTKETKKKICILLKTIGDEVTEETAVIYIDKNFSSIDLNNIYKMKEIKNASRDLIENQILDTFQEFYNNIIANNIYYIKASSYSMKDLYKNVCLYLSEFKQQYYDNFLELYRNKKIIENDNGLYLQKLSVSLVYKSIDIKDFEGFKYFLNVYYWLKSSTLNKEKIYQIKQSLIIIKGHLDKLDISNSEDFNLYLLSIKQDLYKKILESQMYDEILNKHDDNDLKMYQINRLLRNIKEMKIYPERYNGLNIENEIKSLKLEYEIKINEFSYNAYIYLSLSEWAEYKINKKKIDETKGINFIKNVINKFVYHDISDVIELYFIINKMNNDLSNSTWGWELSEPENINKLISPIFDVNNKIILLLFQSKINNYEKLSDLNYINMENIYTFKAIKQMVVSFSEEMISKYLSFPKNSKEQINQFLDEIIDLCQKQKNDALTKFKISPEIDLKFKKACLGKLDKNDNNIIKFYELYNNILYLDNTVDKFKGYSIIEQKEFLVSDIDGFINNVSEIYLSSLKDDQEKNIIMRLNSKAKNTTVSISMIISKFTNLENLIILAPYYINDFCPYNYKKEEYYFPFKDNEKTKKIPVFIVGSLFDELLIGDISSFGTLQYSKLKVKENTDELANEYLLASIKEIFKDEKEMKNYILNHPKYLSDELDKEEYIRLRFYIKIYQHLDVSIKQNSIIYRKKI